jgi:hypothetical protein
LARTSEGPDELDGGVSAVRTRLETREWQRESFRRVGVTPASNPNCGEGESGAPRLVLAPVRGEEHLGPKHGKGRG